MSVPLVRTLVLYFAVICAVRLMGKRQLGEMDPAELVVTILVSDLAAVPMQDLGIPLFFGLVPIAALVTLEVLLSILSLKSRFFRRLLNGQPAIIIRKGQLDLSKLRQLRLTTEDLVVALRKQSVASVSDVKYGVIEPDGSLTIVLYPQQQPVTAEMLSLSPKDTGLPLVVISDGQMVERSLGLLRLDRDAVVNRLRNRGLRPEEVFLMTLDDCGNMFVQKRRERNAAADCSARAARAPAHRLRMEPALGRKGLHRGRRGAVRRRAQPRPCDLGGGAAAARRSAPPRGDRRDRSALRAACGSA